MAHGLTTAITQITDDRSNVAIIDPVNGLEVDDPSLVATLREQSKVFKNIRDYLEILSQTGVRGSAASLPVAIANDQVVATSIPDVVVSGTINKIAVNALFALPGSYIDIDLNGHSIVTVQATGTIQSIAYYIYASLDGVNFVNCSGGSIYKNYTQGFNPYTDGAICWFPCAGYKRWRMVAVSTITGLATFTLRASVAPPMNYLSSLLTYTNTVFGTVQPVLAAADSYRPTLTPYYYKNLQRKVVSGANTLFGFTANNPNDSLVYLLFYNLSTLPTLLNGTPTLVIPIPPGQSSYPVSNFGLGTFTTGICLAASMTSSNYAPAPLGPDVTIYIRV